TPASTRRNADRLFGAAVLLHRVVQALQGLPIVGEIASLLGLVHAVEGGLNLLQCRGLGRRQLHRPGGRRNRDRDGHLGRLALAGRRRGRGLAAGRRRPPPRFPRPRPPPPPPRPPPA